MNTHPASDTVSKTPISKVAAACLIGTTIEFYDFFIYGTAAALVFPKLFFPEASRSSGTLLAFAAFGVGFLARPLGGVIFGHFGDRLGRKKMLVVSLMIMGVSTVLIGCCPPTPPSERSPPPCSCYCDSPRAWPSAANGVVRS